VSARGARAGAAAAVVWIAVEPLAQRVCGTPYADTRLLGRVVSRRFWWPAGAALHIANGAVFGLAFAAVGGRGWKAGVLAAQVENLALWPAMAAVDRFHPDRRDEAWPPLFRSRRVFVQAAATHALFGAVLGAWVAKPPRIDPSFQTHTRAEPGHADGRHRKRRLGALLAR